MRFYIFIVVGLFGVALLFWIYTIIHQHLPKLRRIPRVRLTREQIAERDRESERELSTRAQRLEVERAEKRLEERHAARAADLLEFDYRMEALLPHSEHAEKTRLSPRTGCYDCERARQADLNHWRWMIERI